MKISFEGKLFDKAINDIDKMSEHLQYSAVDKFCRNLADVGMNAAAEAFTETTPSWDKVPYLSYEYTERTIVASGEDLLFVEFGTGLFQKKKHEKAEEFGFTPASYSTDHAQFLVRGSKNWETANKFGHKDMFPMDDPSTKKKIWTEGNDPAQGMTKAMDAMRAKIKEAWNDRH